MEFIPFRSLHPLSNWVLALSIIPTSPYKEGPTSVTPQINLILNVKEQLVSLNLRSVETEKRLMDLYLIM
jgi:hypothetical protein